METRKRRVISLLVDNQSGVLARVSSLFCRRGFNIDSLTVSATNDPTVSRITVTVSGSDKELQQLILQTERLEVTRQVFVLDHDKALERELLLLKVEADVHNRAELREVGSIYKAKIIDLSPDSMVFELIGRPDKLDAFLKMFEGYNILEQCRENVCTADHADELSRCDNAVSIVTGILLIVEFHLCLALLCKTRHHSDGENVLRLLSELIGNCDAYQANVLRQMLAEYGSSQHRTMKGRSG